MKKRNPVQNFLGDVFAGLVVVAFVLWTAGAVLTLWIRFWKRVLEVISW